jgi:hypothetical protein
VSQPQSAALQCSAPIESLVQSVFFETEQSGGAAATLLKYDHLPNGAPLDAPAVKLYNLSGGDVGSSRKKIFSSVDDLVIRPNGSLIGLLELSAVFSDSSCNFVGLLSSKSSQRSGVSAVTFKQFVNARQNYHLYYSNIAAASEVVFENPWVRAVLLQPAIAKYINPTLRAFGLPESSANSFVRSDVWASLPFFVAKREFWKGFNQFLENGIGHLTRILGKDGAAVVLNSQPRDPAIMLEAGLFSLLAEPLLIEFINLRSTSFKALKLRNPRLESHLGFHGSRLMEMRELILKNKDKQLYKYWLGYRNLYLELKLKPDFVHNIKQIEGGVSITFLD